MGRTECAGARAQGGRGGWGRGGPGSWGVLGSHRPAFQDAGVSGGQLESFRILGSQRFGISVGLLATSRPLGSQNVQNWLSAPLGPRNSGILAGRGSGSSGLRDLDDSEPRKLAASRSRRGGGRGSEARVCGSRPRQGGAPGESGVLGPYKAKGGGNHPGAEEPSAPRPEAAPRQCLRPAPLPRRPPSASTPFLSFPLFPPRHFPLLLSPYCTPPPLSQFLLPRPSSLPLPFFPPTPALPQRPSPLPLLMSFPSCPHSVFYPPASISFPSPLPPPSPIPPSSLSVLFILAVPLPSSPYFPTLFPPASVLLPSPPLLALSLLSGPLPLPTGGPLPLISNLPYRKTPPSFGKRLKSPIPGDEDWERETETQRHWRARARHADTERTRSNTVWSFPLQKQIFCPFQTNQPTLT